MDSSADQVISLIMILIGILIFVIFVLVILYFWFSRRPKTAKKEDDDLVVAEEEKKRREQEYGKFTTKLNKESILDFMEFDEIVDNMIVRKNGTQFVMVMQCNGVNYDLMSEDEKIAVEEGFVQFLNTLRFPIQLYVQSRTLNLKDIIDGYKARIDVINNDINKLDAKIAQAKMSGNRPLREKFEFEKRRKINILEYGVSITDYVEKLSANKNVLQQRTYVVLTYYTAELGTGIDRYSKEEIYNMCFSELYTRCQNVSSALATSQVSSEILDSEELAELLYIAYNRDESEMLNLQKAIDSQYDSLYSTGKDVLQKKKEKLDQEINIAAIDLATDSILKADKQKQIEELELKIDKGEKIKERASKLLDTYQNQLDPRVYDLAKENVENSNKKDVKKLQTAKEKTKEKASTRKKTVVTTKKKKAVK